MGYKGKKNNRQGGASCRPKLWQEGTHSDFSGSPLSLSPGGLLSGLDGELMGNRNETYLRYKNLLFVVT